MAVTPPPPTPSGLNYSRTALLYSKSELFHRIQYSCIQCSSAAIMWNKIVWKSKIIKKGTADVQMFEPWAVIRWHFRRPGTPQESNYEFTSKTIGLSLTRRAVLLGEGRPDRRERQKSILRITRSIRLAGTHLHIWVKRGTARVLKCLAQVCKTMSQIRAWTQTT